MSRFFRFSVLAVALASSACGLKFGSDRTDGGSNGATDRFGVPLIYATAPGGREWYLGDATAGGPEWRVETNDITSLGDGLFHTRGAPDGGADSGEVRMEVPSPSGKGWWQNVEMTAYFRYESDHPTPGQLPHFELLARTERHSSGTTTKGNVNGGVAAPSGTRTWPWYSAMSNSTSVREPCLGTSYHGNFYPLLDSGSAAKFEKEVSHSNGYASQQGQAEIPGWDPGSPHQWFGMKFVVRNQLGKNGSTLGVHLELWIDPQANGTFAKATSFDDQGGWDDADLTADGCDASPYDYTPGMLLDWAGPWVIFRSDGMAIDFKWLSVREIGPP